MGSSAATASISITICSITRWSRLALSRTATRFRKLRVHRTLFNTVRRMTDVGLTLFPISKLSFRTGYSHNTDEGPSYSSQHNGAEALYLQNWRNSTDTWMGAVDWKPIPKTMLTFEETVTHYKGDTNWGLTGLDLQLANGMPVTLGFDNQKPPTCGDGNPPIITSRPRHPPPIRRAVDIFSIPGLPQLAR